MIHCINTKARFFKKIASMKNLCSLHHIYVVLSSFILVCFVPSVSSVYAGNETDHLALLSFKAHIKSDPYQVMPTWNDSTHFCNWTGVVCSVAHILVVRLNLSSCGFSGTISPAVGNLSFLRALMLHNNSFTGKVPQEVGKLTRLRSIGISNNLLSGEIPSNLSKCLNLKVIHLGGNNFVGTFPNEFGSLLKIEVINIHSNNLTGEIPKFIGNFTSLKLLSGLGNNFHGSIPDTLGQLSNLMFLGFGSNNLSGVLPPSFFNISSLKEIDLPNNQFSGNLPQNIAQRFPKLVSFNIPINKFTGLIPVSLTNASNLEHLALDYNEFTGSVPSFDRLTRLKWFAINVNHLGNGKIDDLKFVSSLVNCTNLRVLGFGGNKLGGVLPKSMFNLTQLTELTVGGNLISGSIPYEIGQLVKLTRLFMFLNRFTGTIPDSIGKLVNVGAMSLSGNLFSGFIPSSFGNLTKLSMLALHSNNLVGSIPSILSNCKGLQLLILGRNNLSGFIPNEIFGLSSLTAGLDLSNNHFVGPLPSEVGKLRNLVSLNISNNMLSGSIPTSLGACTSLVALFISANVFEGEIPSTLNSLKGLEYFDLSRNNLTGTIPEYLGEFAFLQILNLSYNGFVGKLPDKGTFRNVSKVFINGNAKLCGGFPEFQLPECLIVQESSKKNNVSRVLMIMIPILGVILILVVALVFYLIYKRRYIKESLGNNLDNENFQQLSYRTLHEATNGFSSASLIGNGKFSYVYKANLNQNNGPEVVAVKVLKLAVHGAETSFIAECNALRSIRHRNLVKIITCCSAIDFQGNDFKALVYSYMINGSLEDWLHPNPIVGPENELSKQLNFLQRLNIVIDVASAIDYIHNQCGSPMVHCDIKPSNVLLDSDFIAHLGDFGLARFIQQTTYGVSISHNSSIGLKGTVGYAAPEYGMGSKMSPYGDIYSFGILILELFTGKRPTNDMFSNSLNLHDYVKMAIPHQVLKITDHVLLKTKQIDNLSVGTSESEIYGPIEEGLISVYRIGTACSVESPKSRLDIQKVIDQLHFIKETFRESLNKIYLSHQRLGIGTRVSSTMQPQVV